MPWAVYIHPDAEVELAKLSTGERQAIDNVILKLKTLGPQLAYPHSSAVQGVKDNLRELRPRQGRSPWRALYARLGDAFVVAAIGPEANKDQRRFNRAVRSALDRLAEAEGD